MKVLHIIDSLGLGGAQTVVKGIFEAQKKNKDIFLFALRKREITIKIDHPKVIIFNSERKYSFKPIKQLRKIVEKEKIDVLHCHLFRSQVFGLILKKYYFPNIKLIFHEHGQIFQNNFYYNYFMRKSQGLVNLYIAVSKATKQKLIEKAHIDPRKITVLYNFVDLKKFNRKNIKWSIQKEREKLGIKKGEFVIGFVGRLAYVKGCDILIKALSYIDFPYKVLIAGDGPERKKLEKLAKKLRVRDKIIFLGYRSDVVYVYSLLDVLVMPSRSEASPMALYEAQALKVPIILSNIPILTEFATNTKTNLLFEIDKNKDLFDKLTIFKKYKISGSKIIKNSSGNVCALGLKRFIKNINRAYGYPL